MGLLIESMVFTNPEATTGDALPVTKCTSINNPCCNNKRTISFIIYNFRQKKNFNIKLYLNNEVQKFYATITPIETTAVKISGPS